MEDLKNKFRNELTVTLNGTKYKLRATFEAMANIEDGTGKSFATLVDQMYNGQYRLLEMKHIIVCGSKAAGVNIDDNFITQLEIDMAEVGAVRVAKAITKFLVAGVYGGQSLKKG